MASIKGILFALMGIYMLTLIVVYQNRRVNRELPAEIEPAELEFLKANSNKIELPYGKLYDFINKPLAYNILSQLDVYKPLTDEQRAEFGIPFKYDQAFAGFKSDDQYCEKQRAYFVEYPEFVFQDMNVVQARETDSFVTERIITGFANDIHPNNNDNLPASLWYKPTTEIKPYVNGFFTNNALYAHLRLGKHFSCLAQVSNHIPGNVFISRKDYVAQSAASYMKLYANRPQCLSYDKFFPETWNLADKEECDKFFEIFNSEEYKKLQEERRIVYIKKISGLHRGDGVEPLIPKEEVILRNEYDNGAKCGTNKANVIIQHYIHNPLLLNGRKFDFRMYLLIASTNPLTAYYHDGNLRVSLGAYTSDSDDKKTLLTNIALNQEIYDNAKDGTRFEGMDLAELAHHQQWSMERLQEHLLKEGIIADPNWLDNYLRPEFKKAMVHLVRFSLTKYYKDSSVYELLGVDFMLDTNLNLWFIEANSGPAIKGLPDSLVKYAINMARNHFKIEYGLLRSRMKRVIQYVNSLITEKGAISEDEDGNVKINNLEQRVKEFEAITRNYFDKEFEIGPDNTWHKIIDENLEGVSRYQGYITQECL